METKRKRKTAMLIRWLHIYLSMISFALVFFFAVTGITLNHADKFTGQLHTEQRKGKLDSAWIAGRDSTKIDRLSIVEHLRRTNGIHGSLNDFRIDEDQISIAFKGPGYAADVFVSRPSGSYDLTISTPGLIGIINDLHKGRDTGSGWSLFIDISALLLTVEQTGPACHTGAHNCFFTPLELEVSAS